MTSLPQGKERKEEPSDLPTDDYGGCSGCGQRSGVGLRLRCGQLLGHRRWRGLHGRGGDDTIRGKGGNDFLTGDSGDDTVSGGSGDDLVEGNRDGDLVVGGSGADRVKGGRGKDALIDGLGRDVFKGGRGNDEIAPPGVGPGPPALYRQSDSISCGPGEDKVIAHPLDEVAADCGVLRRLRNPF